MGSKSKIFIVLEYATGGDLFNNIVSSKHEVFTCLSSSFFFNFCALSMGRGFKCNRLELISFCSRNHFRLSLHFSPNSIPYPSSLFFFMISCSILILLLQCSIIESSPSTFIDIKPVSYGIQVLITILTCSVSAIF